MSLQAPQDQYVQVGQVRTRFWCLGNSGTPVVLLHGFGSSVESWVRNIHALAEQRRVYALDLVGHGRTDKPADGYSMPCFAQFVRNFLETQAVERASLIGNSMGGAVALQFALQFPDQVEKLVLVSSGGLGREVTIALRAATLPFIGEWLTRPSRQGAARVAEAVFYDPTLITDEMIDRSLALAALPGAQEAKLSILRHLCTIGGVQPQVWRPIVDNLSRITAPALIIWGRQDRVLPVAHASVAKARMPNVRLHVWDRCGHAAQLERPEEFNDLVLEFLAS